MSVHLVAKFYYDKRWILSNGIFGIYCKNIVFFCSNKKTLQLFSELDVRTIVYTDYTDYSLLQHNYTLYGQHKYNYTVYITIVDNKEKFTSARVLWSNVMVL